MLQHWANVIKYGALLLQVHEVENAGSVLVQREQFEVSEANCAVEAVAVASHRAPMREVLPEPRHLPFVELNRLRYHIMEDTSE